MPPGVLRIPLRERVDFALHLTLRYARQIATYWPVAAAKALRNPYPEFVSDDELCSLLYGTSMAKLLRTTLDDIDRQRFAPILSAGTTFLKADFSAYAQLNYKQGMYAAPTVALFERDATGRPHLRAIAVADDVFQPHDGDSWELAKLFVLQGAGHHMVMGYGGIPGNSAYPAWRYSPAPEPIVGDYGIFLDHYYDAIVEFTRVVAATVPAGRARRAMGDAIPSRYGNRATRRPRRGVLYVAAGQVDVIREAPDGVRVPLARLSAGEFFGELGLLHAIPRTATVESVSDKTEVLVVGRASFQRLLRSTPSALLDIVSTVCQRLTRSLES